MSKWEEIALGDVLEFQRGFDITKKEQKPGEVPIISSSGITSYHNKWKKKGPGVVIGRKGTLGTAHYISKNYWPHDTTLWVKDFKGNNPRFLYFFLKTMQLENFDIGSSNPTLNRNHLHKIKIRFPKLNIQNKIAAVLSVYDDLIENNNHRIAILEKMAEEIYREWFVRMRFPGHEKVKFEKGMPERWEVVPIDKAITFTGGGTPSKAVKRYWESGDINWYTPSDITSANGMYLFESSEKCTEEGVKNSSAKIFPPYSIMMTSRATIGAIGINTTYACTNQGFITCMPNERYPLVFLYHWLKLNKSYFELLSSGATFSELIKSIFKKIPILTPSKSIMKEFQRNIEPIFNEIERILKSINIMKNSRTLLLSRLISGKLSVEDLDIRFPKSMEDAGA